MKRTLLALALIALAATASAAVSNAELIHNPVLTAADGQDIEITAALTGVTGSAQVRLYYRAKNKERFIPVDMTGINTDLRATIPGKIVGVEGVEYYIAAFIPPASNSSQPTVVSPKTAPSLANFITVRKDEQKPTMQILSPMEDSNEDTANPVITVSFEDQDSGVDPKSVVVKIDGNVVKDTRNIQVFDTLMSYVPGDELSQGKHEVSVAIRDRAGNPAGIKWSFTVKSSTTESKKQKTGFIWDGNLGYETQYGATLTQPADPHASLPYRPYGVNRGKAEVNGRGAENTIKARVSVTDEERTDQQPSDRALATWQNDEGLIALGDYSPNFSELSLYGMSQYRGITLDLRSGGLNEGHSRLIGTWGQTRRAIDLSTANLSSPLPGSVAQYLYGVRWEDGNKYFLWGFNTVTVNDQLGSSNAPNVNTPVFNTVESSDMMINIAPIYLKLKGEVAADLLFQGTSVLGANAGSSYKAGLDWNILPWDTRATFDWRDLGGKFPFIPGGYSSLANPALQTDYRGFESSLHQGLFEGQFSLDLNMNNWHDNLNSQKDGTSGTTVNDYFSVFTSIAPRKLPYLNVGYTVTKSKNDADGNTIFNRLKNDNQAGTLNLSLGYNYFIDSSRSVNGSVSYLNTQTQDLAAQKLGRNLNNNTIVLSTFVNLGATSFNGSLSLGSRDQPGYTSNISGTNTTYGGITGASNNLSLRWNQTWKPKLLDSFTSYDMSLSSDDISGGSKTNGGRNTFGLGGNYYPADHHKFSLSMAYAAVNSDVTVASLKKSDSLAQLFTTASYNFTF